MSCFVSDKKIRLNIRETVTVLDINVKKQTNYTLIIEAIKKVKKRFNLK